MWNSTVFKFILLEGRKVPNLNFSFLQNSTCLSLSDCAVLCLVTQSCSTLWLPGLQYASSSVHGDSPGSSAGVGCHALLQQVFPTQGLNPGLPHCRQILYQLSHHGSPRTPEWVACSFSGGSSQPRNQTGVSCIAGELFYQLSYQRRPLKDC